MADVLRIKRRQTGGSGAPASLANAELAYNEVNHTLYYGEGTGGSGGSATTVVPIAGSGAFLPLSGGAVVGSVSLGGGLSFGSTAMTAGSVDLSHHLALYGTSYGLNIVGGTIQVVNNNAVSGTFQSGWNGRVGAITPAAGAFTTISATGAVSGSGYVTMTSRETLAPSSRPSPLGNIGDISTAFGGDLSKVGLSISYTISGAGTLGTPTSGYLVTPELSAQYIYLHNGSGSNAHLGDNSARTAASASFTKVDNYGQGDCVAHIVYGYVASTLPGATSWLATPAISAYYADMQAGAAHCYLNPMEIDCTDNGFDCAGITYVANLNRTVTTAALGDAWIGLRGQSTGSAAVDAFLSPSGKFTIGLDCSTADYGTLNAAITLAEGQRIFFGAVNTTTWPRDTNPTGPYIESVSNILLLTNGSNQLQVSSTSVLTTGPLIVTGQLSPQWDNNYLLGAPTNRWSNIWCANGTIQTSDATLKTDVQPLPDALPIVSAVNPITFRWKVGGVESTTDQSGERISTEIPGRRLHWGFRASDIKAATDKTGLDFGGYVKAEDGTEALRPDQLISILWKAVQELTAEVRALRGG